MNYNYLFKSIKKGNVPNPLLHVFICRWSSLILLAILTLGGGQGFSQCVTQPLINFPFNGNTNAIITSGAGLAASTPATFNASNGVATTGAAFFSNPTPGGIVQATVPAGLGSTNVSMTFTITGANLKLFKTFGIYFQTQKNGGNNNPSLSYNYSVNGGTFVPFTGSVTTLNTTYQVVTGTLPVGANNPTTSLAIRITATNPSFSSAVTWRVDNFQVRALPDPDAPVTTDASICSGGVASISATNNGSPVFNWFAVPTGGSSLSTSPSYSPVNGDPTVPTPYSNIISGVYTYYAEASLLGCAAPRTPTSVTVGIPVTVNPIASPGAVCSGTNTSLNANIDNGSVPFTISWTPSTFLSSTTSATPTVNGITATTTYTVNVTDACGNSATGSVTVDVNPLPIINITTVPAPPVICASGSVTLTGNGANTYSWSPATNLNTTSGATVISNTTTTRTYTVTGTDINGCSATSSVQVVYSPAINPVAGSNTPFCPGGNINLTSTPSGMSYQWSGPNGFSSTAQNPVISGAGAAEAGTYIVTVTDANNCTASASTVVLLTIPVGATANIVSTVPSPLCGQGNANLNADPVNGKSPYAYEWTPATFLNSTTSKTPVATAINATTTYTVTITDACGFSATAQTTVNILSNPTVSVVSSPLSALICTSSSVTLSASGNASSYSWTPASGLGSTTGASVSASPLLTTIYTVTGTGANGCTTTQTKAVNVIPEASLTATATSTNLCIGSNTSLLATAKNTSSYSVSSIPFGFIPTDGYTEVSLGNNAMSGSIPMPFNFSFYGQNFSNFFIGSNGFIQFGTNSGSTGVFGQTLPNVSNPNNIIAGVWADLRPSSGGTIKHGVFGSTPNRIFIVEFNEVPFNDQLLTSLGEATFQIQMYESENKVEVHVQTVANSIFMSSSVTTLGLKNHNGSGFTAPSGRFNNGNWTISSSEGWRFMPAGGTYNFTWSPSTFLSSTTISNPVAQNVTGSTTYTVTATEVNGCSATKTMEIIARIPDVSITQASTANCFGQPVVLSATSSNGFTNGVTGSNNSPASIATLGASTVSRNITIGAGELEAPGDLEVTINLTHDVAGNLKATLSGPCGTTVLFDRLGVPAATEGNTNSFIGKYIFNLAAAGGLSETGPLPPDNYKPTDINGNIHSFTGLTFPCNNIAGTWTLTIQDFTIFDGGSLNNWSITANQQNYTSTFSGPPTIDPVTMSGIHNSIADVSVTPPSPGSHIYTVTTTDITGCSATATTQVAVNALPVPVIIPSDTSLCTGELITISAQDGGAYSGGWPAGTLFDYGFGPSTDSLFPVNGPGIYNVTVTLPGFMGSCSAISPNADIEYRDSPVLTVSSSPALCFGGSTGSVTSQVFLGAGPFRYIYYNSLGNIVRDVTHMSSTDTYSNVAAGQYHVIVYDTVNASYPPPSCKSDSIMIIVTEPELLIATETHSTILCYGNTSAVTIGATGGTAGFTGTGAFSQPAGSQVYTVTDANGCSADVTVNISQPDSLVLAVTTTYPPCLYTTGNLTGVVMGGTVPFNYAWSSGSTSAAITGLISDTYTLTVTDAGGCSVLTSVSVSAPGPVTVAGSSTNLLCRGVSTGTISPAVSGGFGPYGYLWNGGVTSPSRSGLPAGNYTVTVTDINGCSKTKTYSITQPATLMVINSSKTNVRCYGLSSGSATANPAGGTPPYTYLWNTVPSKTTASATGLTAGIYTCTVTDAIGCAKNLLVTITEPPELSVFQTQSNVSFPGGNDGSATVSVGGGTPGYLYSWNTTPVKTTSTVTGLTAGTYKCTVTDTKSCTVKASFVITEPIARPGEPSDQIHEWNISANPNPTTGMLMISFNHNTVENYSVTLADYTGRILYNKESVTTEGHNETLYDFTLMAKGVYLITIATEDKKSVKKVVIH